MQEILASLSFFYYHVINQMKIYAAGEQPRSEQRRIFFLVNTESRGNFAAFGHDVDAYCIAIRLQKII